MIGGVSWESTALYYKLINEAFRNHFGDLTSAKLIISSLNYQEMIDYKSNNEWNKMGEVLVNTANGLEKAGANYIVICCNTLHKIAPFIIDNIKLPFIHIADAAGLALKEAKIKKVGFLGTQFTMEDGFYSDILSNKFQIEVLIPEKEIRFQIDNIIFKELCVGKVLPKSKQLLLQVIHSLMGQGAQAILLACTELGIMIQQGESELPIFDTTLLHAKEIVSAAIKNTKGVGPE